MNPIVINSTNVGNFGFQATFKLYEKLISFDISELTTFLSGGAANVLGVYIQIIDPTGITILDYDPTTPSIVPNSSSTFDFNIPSMSFAFGWWTINVKLIDADNKEYIATVVKNICLPVGFDPANNFVPGVMQSAINCTTPSIKVSEQTVFVYNGLAADEIVKDGTLYYPQGTLDPVTFVVTPFGFSGLNSVYTGDYAVINTSTATYNLGDYTYVEVKYFTNLKFSVACSSRLTQILCCLEELQDVYNNSPQSNKGIDAKERLDLASVPLYIAALKEQTGQDASDDVAQIRDILNCDCNCNPVNVEPILVGIDGDAPTVQVLSGNGISVTSEQVGNNINYTVSQKVVQLAKDDSETGFVLQKTTTGTNINYFLTFNYVNLATNILNTISSSPTLVTLLQSIVGAVSSGLNLNGLNGGCVIDIANCSYSLVEANNAVKTIVSITIGGTVHNAPGGLLLSNPSGISAWLNGLTLGTFTVNYDSGSNSTSIASAVNSNLITAFAMSSGGNPIIRQFNRACIGLVDFLNAMVDYICNLSALQIEYGVTGDSLMTYNGSGNIITTEIDPTEEVGTLISAIIGAQNALYTKLNNISVSCASIKALFNTSAAVLAPTDGLFGLKAGACARVLFPDLANIIMTAIAGDGTLSSQFCAMVASCSAPVCSPPTSTSGVLSSGPSCSPVTNITGSVS